MPDPHNLGLPLFFDIPGDRYVVGALQPGDTYTRQTIAAKEYQNKVPSTLKNSHLPISGLILEPRTFQVNGEEVKGRSTLTSYKKGQATPGFHTLRATPKRRGRPQLQEEHSSDLPRSQQSQYKSVTPVIWEPLGV